MICLSPWYHFQGEIAVVETVLPLLRIVPWGGVCLGMLVPSCLGMSVILVSLAGTRTLGGGSLS